MNTFVLYYILGNVGGQIYFFLVKENLLKSVF
jgi:hypothetical protein